MKAIILAAGYATRLYPLTKDQPKALLPIGGRPILDYIVGEINTVPDIDAIYVVSNHKFFGHFREWAAGVESAVPVVVLDDGTDSEGNRRGAIGDILFALSHEDIDDELVVIAGDNFFTYKLRDFFDFYRAKGGDCVAVRTLEDREALKGFAVVLLDGGGRVVDLEEKPQNPKSNLAVYATYFYTRETAGLFGRYIAEGNNPDAPGHFPQWLYKVKDVYAWEMNGECYDIGTPEMYEEVSRRFE